MCHISTCDCCLTNSSLRICMAGNIFDLGAAASAQRYESGKGAGFHCALEQLLPRPWVGHASQADPAAAGIDQTPHLDFKHSDPVSSPPAEVSLALHYALQ